MTVVGGVQFSTRNSEPVTRKYNCMIVIVVLTSSSVLKEYKSNEFKTVPFNSFKSVAMLCKVSSNINLVVTISDREELMTELLDKSAIMRRRNREEFCCNMVIVASARDKSSTKLFSHPVQG